MTQEIIDKEEVLKMARQAGWPDWEIVGMKGELKAFAKLVAAKAVERERERIYAEQLGANTVEVIRARGEPTSRSNND